MGSFGSHCPVHSGPTLTTYTCNLPFASGGIQWMPLQAPRGPRHVNVQEIIGLRWDPADPMVGSVLTAAGLKGVSLRGFIVRKEAKQHGTEKWIEGILTKNARVLILEDVITTGGSVLKAIRRVAVSYTHLRAHET